MQPPPPQFSPDGLFWWDGARWVPRPGIPPLQQPQPPPYAPPSQFYPPPPPPPPGYSSAPSWLKPSPGLRIVLLIALSLEVGATGLLGVVFFGSTIGGAQENPAAGYVLGVGFAGLFVLSMAALVGVSMRTAWSRWVAIAVGILISWTCVGAVIGIPVIVTAARAPDLTPRRA
jgi:hypothetical protein